VGVNGERGYNPTWGVVGRKRHALTDPDGRLLVAGVWPANLHDSYGRVALLQTSRRLWSFLVHCFADRTYRGKRVGTTTVVVEIVAPEEG